MSARFWFTLILAATLIPWAHVSAAGTSGSSFSPNWAPDGKRIVFVFRRDGDQQIHVMADDGSGRTQLTNPKSDEENDSPLWSPDGSRIAFVRKIWAGAPQTSVGPGIIIITRPSIRQIYVMNPDGSAEKQLTSSGSSYFPVWSPDGRHIAFVSDRDGGQLIFVMNADGTEQRRLTQPSSRRGSLEFGLRWSPDGQRIVFTSNRDGTEQIYVVKADGSELKRLTSTGIVGLVGPPMADGLPSFPIAKGSRTSM